jgi:UDPglucose 6-dehydrogenase
LPLGAPIVKTSTESAEIIKYAANNYLALRIGFIDQIASLSEKAGADVQEIIEGIGLDNRIGKHYWYPGIGYGGYCFPKDVAALAVIFKKAGLKKNLFSLLDQINQERPGLYAQKLTNHVGKNKTAAVLGLTAKPGTTDMRGSQALYFIEALIKKGVRVRVFDPMGMEEARKILDRGVTFCSSAEEAAKGAGAIAILCEWPDFKSLDWAKIKKLMKGGLVFDAKRMFNKQKLVAWGFEYLGVGI